MDESDDTDYWSRKKHRQKVQEEDSFPFFEGADIEQPPIERETPFDNLYGETTAYLESALTEDAVPPSIRLQDGRAVDMSPHRENTILFARQSRALAGKGLMCPGAHVNLNNGYEGWIPADLAFGRHHTGPNLEQAVEETERRLKRAGISAGTREPRVAEDTFRMYLQVSIIRSLTSRIAHMMRSPPQGETLAIPESSVRVHTVEPGETVIFCMGYFLSTRQGFGRSTPAMRTIPHGNYLFGVMTGEDVRFHNLLWTVTGDTDIHLPGPRL